MAKIPLMLCRRAEIRIKTYSACIFVTRFVHKGPREELAKGLAAGRREEYAATEKLQLPSNVSHGEKNGFSKQRSRDICGTCIEAISAVRGEMKLDVAESSPEAASYDCSGSLVDLSSAMQTNVPYPFRSTGKPTHLNMPHGRWRQEEKYMSGELHGSHHVNCAPGSLARSGTSPTRSLTPSTNTVLLQSKCFFSSEKELSNVDGKTKLRGRERLVAALKEYGTTVAVVHVTLAVINLSLWYLLIASGFDATTILENWGSSEGAAAARTAAPIVVAYIVHKLTAPPRIALTLGVAPVIVRYLRKKGFLRKRN